MNFGWVFIGQVCFRFLGGDVSVVVSEVDHDGSGGSVQEGVGRPNGP